MSILRNLLGSSAMPAPNRYVCSVLTEMRDTIDKLNIFTVYRAKRFLPILVEEAQTMVNRMECTLEDKEDADVAGYYYREARKIKTELIELEAKKRELEEDIDLYEDMKKHLDALKEGGK